MNFFRRKHLNEIKQKISAIEHVRLSYVLKSIKGETFKSIALGSGGGGEVKKRNPKENVTSKPLSMSEIMT